MISRSDEQVSGLLYDTIDHLKTRKNLSKA